MKQIRLFWRERGSCTVDMAYHQMAPIMSNTLEQCQLNKTKAGMAAACMLPAAVGIVHCTRQKMHVLQYTCTRALPFPWLWLTISTPGTAALQCMHLCCDTSPVLLATSGASLSLIELYCRQA